MLTIVKPLRYIENLWGKQRIIEGNVYRLMYYVLQVKHAGKVLLHNVVTGHLVVLELKEIEMMEQLPRAYSPIMDQLVTNHFLVPKDYNEHDVVVNMRHVLNKMLISGNHSPHIINNYTILPTTSCNARCYYCFETGVHSITMNEQTANNVVKFIAEHCGEDRKISIRWFGGEPTVAAHRIDQICSGLIKYGIDYSSSMTTNGFLFDEKMVSRAKSLWHLNNVMITVDGTEKNYNEIKAYPNIKDNPYQRVMRNIELLLNKGIEVALRMNFDLGNYEDFNNLIQEACRRYQGNKLLKVYSFPIKGEYPDKFGNTCHASEEWFEEILVKLNDNARKAGLFDLKRELPSLNFYTCNAGTPSFMVITPEGKLGRCTGIFFKEEQIIGNVADGPEDSDYYKSWTRFADPDRCAKCSFFPNCVLIEKCPGIDRCFKKETYRQYEEAIKRVFGLWLNRNQYK